LCRPQSSRAKRRPTCRWSNSRPVLALHQSRHRKGARAYQASHAAGPGRRSHRVGK
jgi:hypothetical protein